ncbi:MAG: hypothetical protein CMI53_04410 [Parcubacteria group bacterium]|jgi:thiol-disulfide isomerase/thioredoxin|nr:hypothetical protein [Parcubacteria group bacterium]|tara:strand:- start:11728 stop:12975 length:1248 start_codon:yes stop_codon:yes gene_type:complete
MKNSFFKLVVLFSLTVFLLPNFIIAQDSNLPTVNFFHGDGCPHCADEKEFFIELQKEFPSLVITEFEVWYNRDNASFLSQAAKELNIKNSGVPVTIIGEQVVVGFSSAKTTGERIRKAINHCLDNKCVEAVGQIAAGNYQGDGSTSQAVDSVCDDETACAVDGLGSTTVFNIPFIGEVDASAFSLPLLTIVIAGLDGFNPCAMWVLIFLISLLLGMKDRKKMWILGLTFLITSALVYFLFLAAWLNLFLFIGFIVWVRIVIGIFAVGSGVYHLREWYVNKSGLCKVTGAKRKRKIMDKFKEVTAQKKFWLVLSGIISIAIAVNMIELVCSAGLPAIYTQVLALSDLPTSGYYLYLLLYIFIFLLDDLFIFVVAMTTLKMAGLTGKYSRWSSLIGGIVIFILGILLIFRPEWIMFG